MNREDLLYVPHPVEDAMVAPLIDPWLRYLTRLGPADDLQREAGYHNLRSIGLMDTPLEPSHPLSGEFQRVQTEHEQYVYAARRGERAVNVAYEALLIIGKEALRVKAERDGHH